MLILKLNSFIFLMACLHSWCLCDKPSGPPGTGKTSLCKGLAQKLSITLSGRCGSFLKKWQRSFHLFTCHSFLSSLRRYAYSQFVEINSHSLFSKWFSEVQPDSWRHSLKLSAHMKLNVMWLFYRVENWLQRCSRRFRSLLMIKMLWCLS